MAPHRHADIWDAVVLQPAQVLARLLGLCLVSPWSIPLLLFRGSFTACAGPCGTAKNNGLIWMQMRSRTEMMKKMRNQVTVEYLEILLNIWVSLFHSWRNINMLDSWRHLPSPQQQILSPHKFKWLMSCLYQSLKLSVNQKWSGFEGRSSYSLGSWVAALGLNQWQCSGSDVLCIGRAVCDSSTQREFSWK